MYLARKLKRFLQAKRLEYIYKDLHLQIGSTSFAHACRFDKNTTIKNNAQLTNVRFSQNNLIYDYANLHTVTLSAYNTVYDNVHMNNVTLGDFTYIASNTAIHRTTIGKFCSIGPDCKLGLGKHPSSTFISTHPYFFLR